MRHVKRLVLLVAALQLTSACGDERAACVDAAHLELCDGDDCRVEACRGDAVCVATACVAWQDSITGVDFSLTHDPANARRISVQVADGGFPRAWVEQLRVDFGDDYAGWGEYLQHEYAAAGVYPVRVEVRLQGYVELHATRLAVAQPPTEWNPLQLTVNAIPDYLNGSRPYHSDSGTPGDPSDDNHAPFHLLLPTHGFTVDVQQLQATGNEIDPASLTLVADRALGGGAWPVGADLAVHLVFASDPVDRVPAARWRVDEAAAFPVGETLLTLRGTTLDGRTHERSLRVEAVEMTPLIDPFDRPMHWLLRFDMDAYATSAVQHPNGAIELMATLGADGVPDFEQELRLVGAQGGESAAGADSVRRGGRVGANAVYRGWVQDAIIAELYRFFHCAPDGTPRDGIELTLAAHDDPGAPEPATFAADGEFSMMRFGGSFVGYLGFSLFSPHNEVRIDDTTADLGVATATLINVLSSAPVLTDELGPIKPNTGMPVGDHPLDATVLDPAFDRWAMGNTPQANERWDALDRIAHHLALVIASVAAHEMGHAMGLVPNEPPPAGFFGGRSDVSFIGAEFTNSHHADYPPLNLMQAGGNPLAVMANALARVEVPRSYGLVELLEVFARENRLSPYARSYLQRRLTYRSFFSGKRRVACP